MISPITNHIERALERLLEQYKGKPRIEALISSFIQQAQDVEDALFDLFTRLDITASEGVQLDNIGIIIGQPRDGLSDADYRTRLMIRIYENTSKSTPDTLIQVFQLLTESSVVMLTELFIAEVMLMGNAEIPSGQEYIIYRNLQSVAPAGVRVAYLGSYDPTEAFAFEGSPDGQGFGDLTDGSIGGKFAKIDLPLGYAFQFTPGSDNNGGFGDTRDPLIGGLFASL